MPAFMLVQATVTDPERFAEYAQKVPDLVRSFGGFYRVIGGNPQLIEGDWDKESVVLSEWPDVATIHTFWKSPEYEAINKLREGAADISVMILEGLPGT